MVNPSNKNLRQSLMTNLTIPIFPLWQSLIRKLTILFFLISIPNIELTILTIKNDKFDEISATKNKIVQDPARSCKIPRATADNIRQLKLTENWPIILWRKFDSYPHDFCLTSNLEKLKRETTTTTDNNRQQTIAGFRDAEEYLVV